MKMPIQTFQPLPPSQESANSLTDADLTKLANLLKPKLPSNQRHTKPPVTYTGVAQGKDDKGRDITYCWSHGWTRNLDHNSKSCSRTLDGHKQDATLNNKMGGFDGQIRYRRSPKS